MAAESLESKIQRFESPLVMLRDSPVRRFAFPYPEQHSNWHDEQLAWTRTAVLFDQSHHMTDVYFRGPDVKRLLSDTGTNSFTTFGRDKSKHFVACNHDGHLIGTAVLFGLEEDEVSLVGPPSVGNWLQFQAETGDYDVEVVRDERTADNSGERLTFRLEVEGPAAREIIEKAIGSAIGEVKFFAMTEFSIGGVPVRALSHTMAGVPGSESMGLEIWGAAAEKQRVFDALLEAGQEFGLVKGGALAYYTGGAESGYLGQPVPAVYTGRRMESYRQWLPGDGHEGTCSIAGSFSPEGIEGFYVTPYDFGYGHLVKFDHDFIGRAALEKIAGQPHRSRVWLRWNEEDVARVYSSSLFGGENRAKYLDTPLARYARVQADAVMSGGKLIGVASLSGYTENAGAWISSTMIDDEYAQDGAQVTLLWGEENGGTAKQTVERHVQVPIRAIVRTSSPLA